MADNTKSDQISEAAAARLRGQIEMFPTSILTFVDHKIALRTVNFRDAVAAITFSGELSAVSPDELEDGLPGDNIFRLGVRSDTVRIASVDRDFQTWVSLDIAPDDRKDRSGVNLVIPKHYLVKLDRVKPEGPDAVTRLVLSEDRRMLTLFEEGAELRMTTAPSVEAGTSLNNPQLNRWKLDSVRLERALQVVQPMMDIDASIGRAERSRRKSAGKTAAKTSAKDALRGYPVVIRDGALIAGGAYGFASVQHATLDQISLSVSVRTAKLVRRMLRRMDQTSVWLNEYPNHYELSDNRLGCSFPKSRLPFPDVRLFSAEPHRASFFWPNEVSLKIGILFAIKPDEASLSWKEESGSTFLTARTATLTDSGQTAYPIALMGELPKDWRAALPPVSLAKLADFAYGPSEDSVEIKLADKLIRACRTRDDMACGLTLLTRVF